MADTLLVTEEVKEAGTACLVHCMSGMSRSSAFVLAHMVKSLGMTLRDAMVHTKERRPRASPNPGEESACVAAECWRAARARETPA